jgi:phosphohistidine phosphatase SixA
MKHLFIIRHGDYNDNGLTDKGREQIEKIADQMKGIIDSDYKSIYLLASPALRTIQSAEIIAKKFGLEKFEKNDLLLTRGGVLELEKKLAIDNLISQYDNKDVVAVVAHLETAAQFSFYMARKTIGTDRGLNGPEKGEGIYFNLEAKTCQMIYGR